MKKLIGFVCLLSLFSLARIVAQEVQPLPLDTAIRYGKLPNGLTYYIRHNEQPKDRAEFYIAQKVGAILENDDQNGLAHFLEHMAFNGTKNFPGKGVINFLEKYGVKFGENINAYTSLDETVYNLSDVPTLQEGVIDSALLVLHDWSGFISLEGGEIDSERGVIREEWRQGAGADRRMWKESNKLKYPGSQYAKRDVIGDTAVINNFSYKTLRDYYQKWYRPDLQGILVVGDVNVDVIEAKIKVIFADIPAPVNAAERVIYPILDNKEPIIAIVKDKEARMTRIGVEIKHDKMPENIKKSMNGYVVGIVNSLISSMISERIEEISQQADAPFVGGYAGYGELVKSKDGFEMLIVPKEGQESAGTKAMFIELEKLKRYGFTNAELERAKTTMLKGFETAYNDRKNQKNNSLVREYVRNFLDSEPVPGIEWEYQTIQMILPQLKAENVNQIAKSYIKDDNMVIYVMAPDKDVVKIPAEQEILAALAAAKTADIAAKAEEDLNKPLIENAPKAGKIKKVTTNSQFGTTTWMLGNGAKVIFKPTKFKEDEILLSAYSPGGISKVKDQGMLVSANFATSVVGNNGLGNYNQIELGKVLTGKIASTNPYISQYSEGFNGRSSVKDFETMLQLIYLNFTGVRQDDNAFSAMINMYKATLSNSDKDPRKAFSDTINIMASNRHKRTVLVNLQTISQIDQLKAIQVFKERFNTPADFTFVFTGNVNPEDETVKNAVLTYLASINIKAGNDKPIDHKIRSPRGLVENKFVKEMKIKKASNYILYNGHLAYNLENQIRMEAIGSILDLRYTETIREKEGGTYGVGVRGRLSKEPLNQGTINISFDTDPEKQAHLMKLIHQEIDTLATIGPKAEDLKKVKENLLKTYEEDLRENSWWQSAVILFDRDKLNYPAEYKKAVEALKAEDVQLTVKKLTEQGNILEVVMKPE